VNAQAGTFLVVWEFRARIGLDAEFERAYGPDGEWADLFRRAEGYLGTELIRDTTSPRRYLTIDRWTSAAAYEQFLQTWRAEYDGLDRQCHTMTEFEGRVGDFGST
jgi:quinol monooxygenase YgiN